MSAGRNKFFRKVVGQSRELNQVQTNVEQAVAEFIKNPLLDGRLIESVALTSSATRLEHKLGRTPRGYLIVKQDAAATVHDSIASETSPDLFLPLIASANVTVSIWIF